MLLKALGFQGAFLRASYLDPNDITLSGGFPDAPVALQPGDGPGRGAVVLLGVEGMLLLYS